MYPDIIRPTPIPGFPGYYATKSGTVLNSKFEELQIYQYKNQYDMVYLRDENNKSHVFGVHQVIAMTFKPDEYYEGCIVHHKNENKYDNRLDNLEILDRSSHGLHHNPFKYFDRIAKCEVCGRIFIWTSKRQRIYYADTQQRKIKRNRMITCSKSCSSYAGRMIQLNKPLVKT